jgi:hypothetical protein
MAYVGRMSYKPKAIPERPTVQELIEIIKGLNARGLDNADAREITSKMGFSEADINRAVDVIEGRPWGVPPNLRSAVNPLPKKEPICSYCDLPDSKCQGHGGSNKAYLALVAHVKQAINNCQKENPPAPPLRTVKE